MNDAFVMTLDDKTSPEHYDGSSLLEHVKSSEQSFSSRAPDDSRSDRQQQDVAAVECAGDDCCDFPRKRERRGGRHQVQTPMVMA
jgi:hypothetical protein